MSKFLLIIGCWLLYVHVLYMYIFLTCTLTLITLMYDYMYMYMYMCVVHVYGFVWPLFYHFLIGINQVYTSSHFILISSTYTRAYSLHYSYS